MAGDWIKLEHATLDKPEVLAIANDLGITQGDALLACLRLWVWADQQSLDGCALRATSAQLNRIAGATDFARALARVGWLEEVEDGFAIPNFGRHNTKTAKRRAIASESMRTKRAAVALSAQHSRNENRTREEKRREENSKPPPIPPAEESQPSAARVCGVESSDSPEAGESPTRRSKVFGVAVPPQHAETLQKAARAAYAAWPTGRKVGQDKARAAAVRSMLRIAKSRSKGLPEVAEWYPNRTAKFAAIVGAVPADARQFIPHPMTWFNRDGPLEPEEVWRAFAERHGAITADGKTDEEREREAEEHQRGIARLDFRARRRILPEDGVTDEQIDAMMAEDAARMAARLNGVHR